MFVSNIPVHCEILFMIEKKKSHYAEKQYYQFSEHPRFLHEQYWTRSAQRLTLTQLEASSIEGEFEIESINREKSY